jgi:hypothetical protein
VDAAAHRVLASEVPARTLRFHSSGHPAAFGDRAECQAGRVISRPMPGSDNEAAIDAAIAVALAAGRDDDWLALWEAVDALAEETTFATWAGGDVIDTMTIDGEERAVIQMPYPRYTEPVGRVGAQLGALGLFVPFDWPGWDGVRRYQDDPAALADAPVGDAVRLLVAIHRSERFCDGGIDGALRSGVMQAALARLRDRYLHERTADPAS